jgi:type I restriction enzyme S subunit
MLPEGWKRFRVDEVGSVITGNTPPTNDAGNYGGEIPFITPGDIGRGKYIDTAERTLSETGVKHARLLPVGSVVVTCIGSSIGKIGLTTQPSASNQQINAIVICENHDPEYVYYQLEFYSEALRRLAGTQAVPIVNKSTFEGLILRFPHFQDEETEITDVLKTWDAAVAITEKLITNSRRQKQALMQQLLTGKRRLPGFSGEWNQFQLGKLFKERVENARGDLPLLSITRDEGVIPRGDVGRKDTSNEDKSKYLRICSGDIGYNTMRMWQGVSALSAYEGIISPAYTVLVPQAQMDGRFSAYLFKFKPVVFLFYRYSQGLVSDTWNLKYPHFAEIKVFIPERKEQEAIADVLAAADEEIAIRVKELKGLQEEKRALMQQLLTGKRRVRLPIGQVSA